MHDLWKEIAGQIKTIEILEFLTHSGKIPHALLFKGPEGVGKFFTAIQFLKSINTCEDSEHQNRIFKKISSLNEPYVKLVLPLPRGKGESSDNTPLEKLSQNIVEDINAEIKKKAENPYYKIKIDKANTIKMSSIREIKKDISYNYHEMRYRGVIICDAHIMSIESQNALLKSLEEPPEGVVFFLLTDSDDKLLPTIKSRCWVINFEPLSEKDLNFVLTKWYKLEKSQVEEVIPFSEGSVTNAIEFLENDFHKIIDSVILILRYSLAGKYYTAINEMNKYIDRRFTFKFQLLVKLILVWLNDVERNRAGLTDFSFKGYSDTVIKFNNKFPEADIEMITCRLNRILDSVDKNLNLNILAVNTIFTIASTVIR